MTDDAELIARLRTWARDIQTGSTAIWAMDQDLKAAAARIEQLKHRLFQCATDLQIYMDAFAVSEAKLATCEKYRDAYAECDRVGTQAVRDLEGKLAKAVEALEDIVKDCEADYPPSHGAIKYFARATLAEIKGGNDAKSDL